MFAFIVCFVISFLSVVCAAPLPLRHSFVFHEQSDNIQVDRCNTGLTLNYDYGVNTHHQRRFLKLGDPGSGFSNGPSITFTDFASLGWSGYCSNNPTPWNATCAEEFTVVMRIRMPNSASSVAALFSTTAGGVDHRGFSLHQGGSPMLDNTFVGNPVTYSPNEWFEVVFTYQSGTFNVWTITNNGATKDNTLSTSNTDTLNQYSWGPGENKMKFLKTSSSCCGAGTVDAEIDYINVYEGFWNGFTIQDLPMQCESYSSHHSYVKADTYDSSSTNTWIYDDTLTISGSRFLPSGISVSQICMRFDVYPSGMPSFTNSWLPSDSFPYSLGGTYGNRDTFSSSYSITPSITVGTTYIQFCFGSLGVVPIDMVLEVYVTLKIGGLGLGYTSSTYHDSIQSVRLWSSCTGCSITNLYEYDFLRYERPVLRIRQGLSSVTSTNEPGNYNTGIPIDSSSLVFTSSPVSDILSSIASSYSGFESNDEIVEVLEIWNDGYPIKGLQVRANQPYHSGYGYSTRNGENVEVPVDLTNPLANTYDLTQNTEFLLGNYPGDAPKNTFYFIYKWTLNNVPHNTDIRTAMTLKSFAWYHPSKDLTIANVDLTESNNQPYNSADQSISYFSWTACDGTYPNTINGQYMDIEYIVDAKQLINSGATFRFYTGGSFLVYIESITTVTTGSDVSFSLASPSLIQSYTTSSYLYSSSFTLHGTATSDLPAGSASNTVTISARVFPLWNFGASSFSGRTLYLSFGDGLSSVSFPFTIRQPFPRSDSEPVFTSGPSSVIPGEATRQITHSPNFDYSAHGAVITYNFYSTVVASNFAASAGTVNQVTGSQWTWTLPDPYTSGDSITFDIDIPYDLGVEQTSFSILTTSYSYSTASAACLAEATSLPAGYTDKTHTDYLFVSTVDPAISASTVSTCDALTASDSVVVDGEIIRKNITWELQPGAYYSTRFRVDLNGNYDLISAIVSSVDGGESNLRVGSTSGSTFLSLFPAGTSFTNFGSYIELSVGDLFVIQQSSVLIRFDFAFFKNAGSAQTRHWIFWQNSLGSNLNVNSYLYNTQKQEVNVVSTIYRQTQFSPTTGDNGDAVSVCARLDHSSSVSDANLYDVEISFNLDPNFYDTTASSISVSGAGIGMLSDSVDSGNGDVVVTYDTIAKNSEGYFCVNNVVLQNLKPRQVLSMSGVTFSWNSVRNGTCVDEDQYADLIWGRNQVYSTSSQTSVAATFTANDWSVNSPVQSYVCPSPGLGIRSSNHVAMGDIVEVTAQITTSETLSGFVRCQFDTIQGAVSYLNMTTSIPVDISAQQTTVSSAGSYIRTDFGEVSNTNTNGINSNDIVDCKTVYQVPYSGSYVPGVTTFRQQFTGTYQDYIPSNIPVVLNYPTLTLVAPELELSLNSRWEDGSIAGDVGLGIEVNMTVVHGSGSDIDAFELVISHDSGMQFHLRSGSLVSSDPLFTLQSDVNLFNLTLNRLQFGNTWSVSFVMDVDEWTAGEQLQLNDFTLTFAANECHDPPVLAKYVDNLHRATPDPQPVVQPGFVGFPSISLVCDPSPTHDWDADTLRRNDVFRSTITIGFPQATVNNALLRLGINSGLGCFFEDTANVQISSSLSTSYTYNTTGCDIISFYFPLVEVVSNTSSRIITFSIDSIVDSSALNGDSLIVDAYFQFFDAQDVLLSNSTVFPTQTIVAAELDISVQTSWLPGAENRTSDRDALDLAQFDVIISHFANSTADAVDVILKRLGGSSTSQTGFENDVQFFQILSNNSFSVSSVNVVGSQFDISMPYLPLGENLHVRFVSAADSLAVAGSYASDSSHELHYRKTDCNQNVSDYVVSSNSNLLLVSSPVVTDTVLSISKAPYTKLIDDHSSCDGSVYTSDLSLDNDALLIRKGDYVFARGYILTRDGRTRDLTAQFQLFDGSVALVYESVDEVFFGSDLSSSLTNVSSSGTQVDLLFATVDNVGTSSLQPENESGVCIVNLLTRFDALTSISQSSTVKASLLWTYMNEAAPLDLIESVSVPVKEPQWSMDFDYYPRIVKQGATVRFEMNLAHLADSITTYQLTFNVSLGNAFTFVAGSALHSHDKTVTVRSSSSDYLILDVEYFSLKEQSATISFLATVQSVQPYSMHSVSVTFSHFSMLCTADSAKYSTTKQLDIEVYPSPLPVLSFSNQYFDSFTDGPLDPAKIVSSPSGLNSSSGSLCSSDANLTLSSNLYLGTPNAVKILFQVTLQTAAGNRDSEDASSGFDIGVFGSGLGANGQLTSGVLSSTGANASIVSGSEVLLSRTPTSVMRYDTCYIFEADYRGPGSRVVINVYEGCEDFDAAVLVAAADLPDVPGIPTVFDTFGVVFATNGHSDIESICLHQLAVSCSGCDKPTTTPGPVVPTTTPVPIAYSTVLFDTFSRPDGEPGQQYVIVDDTARISDYKICSNETYGKSLQLVQQLVQPSQGQDMVVRISFNILPGSLDSTQAMAVAFSSSNSYWLAGCAEISDNLGRCQLTIRDDSGFQSAVSASSIDLSALSTNGYCHRVQVYFTASVVSVEIYDTCDTELLTPDNLLDDLSYSGSFSDFSGGFGLFIGLDNDQAEVCVDQFLVECESGTCKTPQICTPWCVEGGVCDFETGKCDCPVNKYGNCALERTVTMTHADANSEFGFITIEFELETDRAQMNDTDCSKVIRSEDLAELGIGATCTWENGHLLKIVYGAEPSHVPGVDDIGILENVISDQFGMVNSSSTSSSLVQTLTTPSPLPSVTAVITGPPAAGVCDSATFSAVNSGGGVGRPLSFVWGVLSAPDEANVTDLQGATTASIEFGADLPSGSYLIQLEVTNFLSTTANSTLNFTKSSLPIPTVFIDSPGQIELFKSTSIILKPVVQFSVCYEGDKSMAYEWRQDDAPQQRKRKVPSIFKGKMKRDLITVSQSSIYYLKGSDFNDEGEVNVEVDAFVSSNTVIKGSDNVNVLVLDEELVPVILGGNREIGRDKISSFTISATPTDASNYVWECIQIANGFPCVFDSPLGAIPTISPRGLAFGQTYRFKVTVTKSLQTKVSESVDITILDIPAPEVSVETESTTIAQSSKLIISGQVLLAEDSELAQSDFTFAWTLVQGDVDLTSPTVRGSALDNRNLVVRANVLTPGQEYVFKLTATDEFGQSGSSSIRVLVSLPPVNGNCTISPESGTTAQTLFEVVCSGWTGVGSDKFEYALEYKKTTETVFTQGVLPKLSKTMATVLPVGDIVVVAVIRNSFGATTRFELPVRPQVEALVEVELEDVENLLSSFSDLQDNENLLGAVDSLVEIEFDEGGTEVLDSLVGALDSVFSNLIITPESVTKAAGTVGKLLSSQSSNLSPAAQEQLSGLVSNLAAGLENSDEPVSENAANSLVSAVDSLASLLQQSQEDADADNNITTASPSTIPPTTVAGVVFQRSSNESNSTDAGSGVNNTKATGLLSTLSSISVSLSKGIACGEDQQTIDQGDIAVVVNRQAASDVRVLEVSLTNYGTVTFTFPSGIPGLDADECPTSDLRSTAQILQNADPNTTVTLDALAGLTFRRANGTEIPLKNMDPPVLIHFPIPFVNCSLYYDENSTLDSTNNTCYNETLDCIFFDPETDSFSSEGCTTIAHNDSGLYCECTHLTEFSAGRPTDLIPPANPPVIPGSGFDKLKNDSIALTIVVSIFCFCCVISMVWGVWYERKLEQEELNQYAELPEMEEYDILSSRARRDSKRMSRKLSASEMKSVAADSNSKTQLATASSAPAEEESEVSFPSHVDGSTDNAPALAESKARSASAEKRDDLSELDKLKAKLDAPDDVIDDTKPKKDQVSMNDLAIPESMEAEMIQDEKPRQAPPAIVVDKGSFRAEPEFRSPAFAADRKSKRQSTRFLGASMLFNPEAVAREREERRQAKIAGRPADCKKYMMYARSTKVLRRMGQQGYDLKNPCECELCKKEKEELAMSFTKRFVRRLKREHGILTIFFPNHRLSIKARVLLLYEELFLSMALTAVFMGDSAAFEEFNLAEIVIVGLLTAVLMFPCVVMIRILLASLSWKVRYLGFFLSIVVLLLCFALCVAYGLTFSVEQVNNWVVGEVVALFIQYLVLQPGKAALLAYLEQKKGIGLAIERISDAFRDFAGN